MLVVLENTPKNEQEWEIFGFHNRDQINLIRQAIQAQHNLNLPEYQMYPIPPNKFSEWLDRKAQSHQDINSTLGLQGSDLREMDPSNEQQLRSWIYLQYHELFTASASLGI